MDFLAPEIISTYIPIYGNSRNILESCNTNFPALSTGRSHLHRTSTVKTGCAMQCGPIEASGMVTREGGGRLPPLAFKYTRYLIIGISAGTNIILKF